VEEDNMAHLSAYTPSSKPEEDIKEPLERVIAHLISDPVGPDPYSWYAAMILMFSHADLLGHLCSGGSSQTDQAKNAVKFIKDYVGRVDARYQEVGGLLYHMLRHGLIHKSQPKRIGFQDGNILGLSFSDTKKRDQHLKITKGRCELRLKFSIALFYEDLLRAVDLYCDDIRSDQGLRNAYVRAWKMFKEPEDGKKLTKETKYLVTDLDFIKKQI